MLTISFPEVKNDHCDFVMDEIRRIYPQNPMTDMELDFSDKISNWHCDQIRARKAQGLESIRYNNLGEVTSAYWAEQLS